MLSKLTEDESRIYVILTEKYSQVLEDERRREQRRSQPSEDSDISMYDQIPRSERIIKGEGDGYQSNDRQTPPLSDGLEYSHETSLLLSPPTTPNTPKVRLSSQSKEWWKNPQTGEWEEKPQEEDRGNVLESPWKLKSIYEK